MTPVRLYLPPQKYFRSYTAFLVSFLLRVSLLHADSNKIPFCRNSSSVLAYWWNLLLWWQQLWISEHLFNNLPFLLLELYKIASFSSAHNLHSFVPKVFIREIGLPCHSISHFTRDFTWVMLCLQPNFSLKTLAKWREKVSETTDSTSSNFFTSL